MRQSDVARTGSGTGSSDTAAMLAMGANPTFANSTTGEAKASEVDQPVKRKKEKTIRRALGRPPCGKGGGCGCRR